MLFLSFSGRLNRATYAVGMFVISQIYFAFCYFLLYLCYFLITNPEVKLFLQQYNFLLAMLLVVVMQFSYSKRRLHDIGERFTVANLWHFFLPFYLFFKSGQNKTNSYGPKPKKGIHWHSFLSQ